jgi:hypothetical protein
VINEAGHYDLTAEERADKLRKALFRHGKPFAVKLTLLQSAPVAPAPPPNNLLHMKHYQRGE